MTRTAETPPGASAATSMVTAVGVRGAGHRRGEEQGGDEQQVSGARIAHGCLPALSGAMYNSAPPATARAAPPANIQLAVCAAERNDAYRGASAVDSAPES